MSADLDAKVLSATGWSPLRKALHASRGGVAVKVVEFDGSGERLRGTPLALRVLTADESLRLRADALRWLTGACGFTEDFIIGTTDGTAALEFEIKVRTLALALVEPAPPHVALVKDADDLRTILDADEVSGLALARRAETFDYLQAFLSVARLKALLPDVAPYAIERYALPNLRALNFYIRGLLGEGVAASLRSDPQAKTLGEYLRVKTIEIPARMQP